MSEQTLPWQRLDGEPALFFDRFTRFVLQGPGRTIEETYRQEAKAGRSKRPSQHWYRWAKEWRWNERAEAWDALLREREVADYETERKLSREKRREALEAIFVKMIAALPSIDFTVEVRPSEFVYTMRAVMEQLRIEYGESKEVEQARTVTSVNFEIMAAPPAEDRQAEFARRIGEGYEANDGT